MKPKFFSVALVVTLMFGSAVWAAPLNGLYNTGVDTLSNAWVPPNIPDLHYTVTSSPSGAFVPVDIDDTVYPFPPWFPNNAFSRWIGPAGTSAYGPAGNYVYRTTVNVPANAILSSVMVSGLWGTDDPGLDILINGGSTGQVNILSFTALTPFSITSGFNYGPNTIDFIVQNAGGPTGLRVDQISGKYQAVPEPAGIASLLGAALCTLLRGRRRMT